MKKLLAMIYVIAAMLSLSAAALAAESSQDAQAVPSWQGNAPFDGPRMDDRFAFAAPVSIDFDAMVSKGIISQETCERINAYMEEHKPSDPPEMNGQAPEMSGQPPQMNGPMLWMNGQGPEMNGQPPQMNGQGSEMNGQPPQMNGQAPEMNGQYLQMEGRAPWMDEEAPEWNGEDPAVTGLLTELLNEGVITEAEYDALMSAISEEATTLKKSA